MGAPQLTAAPRKASAPFRAAHFHPWRHSRWQADEAYLSILALSAIAVRVISEGWRVFLLFTVVLLFVQFLGLLRRFGA